MSTERQPIVYVSKRHGGAWLIHWVGNHPADQPEDDNFDAASSLVVAKRVAKEGARSYATHLRWVESPETGGWVLEGVEDEWNPNNEEAS